VTLGSVERDRSRVRLARAAQLLELAAERLAQLTAGADHPRVHEAHDWLRAARAQVVRAAGGLGQETRALVSVLLTGVAIGAVAAVLHDLAGLPGGWTVAITLPVTLLGLPLPISRLLDTVDRRIGRRRTAPSGPAMTVPPGVGPAGETLALLRLTRSELGAQLRERSGERSAGAFDRLRRRDTRTAALSAADRDICVTIHAIEIWLRARERDRHD
jgi:hypothetical protein